MYRQGIGPACESKDGHRQVGVSQALNFETCHIIEPHTDLDTREQQGEEDQEESGRFDAQFTRQTRHTYSRVGLGRRGFR